MVVSVWKGGGGEGGRERERESWGAGERGERGRFGGVARARTKRGETRDKIRENERKGGVMEHR